MYGASAMKNTRLKYILRTRDKSIGLKRSSHCYRHSMSNRLRDTDADDSKRAFILGHAAHGITDRVYITRLPLQKMLKALNDAN